MEGAIRNAANQRGLRIVVIGGGFSGALFAIKMAAARPDDRVLLVERDRRPGRGVAYGACRPEHLLNVPVSRMEVGLDPAFADWIRTTHGEVDPSSRLADAFVPRQWFGDYLEHQVRGAQSSDPERGLSMLRGEAVALLDPPDFGVRLWDGREVRADLVILAIGNLPPRGLGAFAPVADDGTLFAPDPWRHDAFDGLARDDGILLIGTGLTTIDIALRLARSGHKGPMLAISRHGLLPQRHRSGGAWHPFLHIGPARSPAELMAFIRNEVARAETAGIPWQRVMDAARPAVANVWHCWRPAERRRFLRHARAYWDVHRHRMAPRVADEIDGLLARGQLQIAGGKVVRVAVEDGRAEIAITGKHGRDLHFRAARIVNCTGPRTDFDVLGAPLVADLRRRRLLRADPLGLGIETSSSALIDGDNQASDRLFALGPLTRPAWWEVTAVPEIAVQIDRLVAQLSAIEAPGLARPLAEAFFDLGSGI